ncbi:MAG TPA: extracellular solute-binding protein [Candidatus Limnocylindrales bacterium]|jgi:iron(III) transport system substrate-binding protein|nr:extracellular solute-binding protein [Candidatus Limnocylindrales bacterium]
MTQDPNAPKPDPTWPKDEFGKNEAWFSFQTIAGLVAFVIFAAFLLTSASHRIASRKNQLVIYCAQDQVYAEPIFKAFQKETGIKVRPIFDSEAVKTVGLANRLLAERNHPQCDLFWGNEEMRTRQLAAQNVFRETNGWAAFGYRSRRMVINTNRLSIAEAPHSLLELTNAAWHGKLALAYPQFGTTATHFHALHQEWGDAGWQTWCHALMANKPLLVDGNSTVVKLVARGEALVGLTDSDDIADGQREGLPVAMLPMTAETLLIPNTVAVVRDAPHPRAAELFFNYVQRREVVEQLIAAKALEGSSTSEVKGTTLNVNWDRLLTDLEPTTAELCGLFLR